MQFSTSRLDKEALERETRLLHETAVVAATTKNAEARCAALVTCKKLNEAIYDILRVGTLDFADSLRLTLMADEK